MIGFPLLLIPVAICNIIVFLMPDLSLAGPVELFSVTLPSLDVIRISLKDVLVALSILLLLLEVMRAARPASKYFTDHFLSLLVAGGAAYEFVMLPKFGNSTFFIITLVAFVDFFAGISLRARRPRRVAAPAYAEPAPHYHPAPAPVAPAPAPVPAAVTPAPVPITPVPPATSVAESVLTERAEPKLERIEPKIESRLEPKIESHSETKPVAPEVVAHTSPQITSPDLQPDSTTEKPKS
jgi:hypothetical protein